MPDMQGFMYHDAITLDIYWGRILAHEIWLTCLFTIAYLVVRFERGMKKVDRMVRGLALCFVLTLCTSMSAGSGGCFNPAIGLVSSIFMIGYENQDGSGLGSEDAKYIWVYMLAPFVGAVLAAYFFKLHDYLDRHRQSQHEPEVFIAPLKGYAGSTSQISNTPDGG